MSESRSIKYSAANKEFKRYYFENSENVTDEIYGEYLHFSKYFQNLCIQPGGYIIDTGNFQTCNLALLEHLEYKRKKHPIIWKIIEWLITV